MTEQNGDGAAVEDAVESPDNGSTGATPDSAAADGPRQRSTIKFPYMDVRDATKIAEVIKNNFGSGGTIDQVAGVLGQTPSSGAFRTRLSSAATFGVLASRRGEVTLTDLGHKVADGQSRSDALVTAFMNVPLFHQLYELFKGKSLPLDPGLEREIEALGVVSNQADRARQVFRRSAEQAGLFWSAKDRLVIPPQANGGDGKGEAGELDEDGEQRKRDNRVVKNAGDRLSDHPLLRALWDTLPDDRAEFTTDQRRRFFTALAFNIDYVYGAPGDGGSLSPEGVAQLWTANPTKLS